MDDQKDILLAKWMDQSISSEELMTLSKDVDLDYLDTLLKQSKSLELETKPAEQMWESFNFPSKVAEVPKRRFINWLIFGVIAIIIILAFLFYNPKKSIKTGIKKTQNFAFIDGSKAYLGPNSMISFDADNYTDNRTISMKGHVYFEVEKGSTFTVKMAGGSVQVLGTSFNIWNVNDEYVTVQCYEGSVKVINDKVNQEQVISAGQAVSFNNNELSDVHSMSRKRPDWMDNQRIYNGIPVNLFLKDLSAYYGITFSNGDINSKELISGIYPTDDIDKAIKTIEVSNQWKHEKTGDKIIFTSSD